MPNIQAKDATGATIYLKSSKANTDLDPAVSQEDLEATLEAISAKLPTLISGRLPVDGSAVTQPVSGTVTANTGLSQPLTDTQLRATAVPISGTVTANTGLSQPLTDTQLRATAIAVDILLIPGVARQLPATASTANTVLTNTCRKISILATGSDIRYSIGSTSQSASATSHFIAAGERLDLGVPATPNIAVIRAGSINASLELTEFL